MQLPGTHPNYKRHIEMVPDEFKHKYHYLTVFGAIFVLISQLQIKARDGLPFIQKKHLVYTEDPNTGLKCYILTNNDASGIIPFMENANGFNSGLFFQYYLTKLETNSTFLFNRPQRIKKAFVLHSNPTNWFENSRMGKNETAKAVTTLCQATGLPKYTNVNVKELRHHRIEKNTARTSRVDHEADLLYHPHLQI